MAWWISGLYIGLNKLELSSRIVAMFTYGFLRKPPNRTQRFFRDLPERPV